MKHFLSSDLAIPVADVLKARLQSLATLDTILMPDWESRFFSFNSKWGVNEMMASMRDGEGSEFFFLFGPLGAVGKIYCRTEQRDPNAILARIPSEFASFLAEPAFNLQQITYCLWQRPRENGWSLVPSLVGRIPLLAFIGDQGEYYRKWAEHYYGRSVSAASVEAIFGGRPLTEDLLLVLNEGLDRQKTAADLAEIGFPMAQ